MKIIHWSQVPTRPLVEYKLVKTHQGIDHIFERKNKWYTFSDICAYVRRREIERTDNFMWVLWREASVATDLAVMIDAGCVKKRYAAY